MSKQRVCDICGMIKQERDEDVVLRTPTWTSKWGEFDNGIEKFDICSTCCEKCGSKFKGSSTYGLGHALLEACDKVLAKVVE